VKAFVGVDIGGTKTAVVLGRLEDRQPEILDREVFPTEHGQGHGPVVDRVCCTALAMLGSRAIPPGDIVGIGISCGGPLDSRKGLVLSPPNLPEWRRAPIVDLVSRALGAPARLQNDANACAVAEWRFGAGRGSSSTAVSTRGRWTSLARSGTSVSRRMAPRGTASGDRSRAFAPEAASRAWPGRRPRGGSRPEIRPGTVPIEAPWRASRRRPSPRRPPGETRPPCACWRRAAGGSVAGAAT
jgi:hypothetical protein